MKKLILMATMALCSISTIESSFFARGAAGTIFNALRNNKMNTMITGLCTYPIITESANSVKIDALAQELINTQQKLINTQAVLNNSISNATLYIVAATLGIGCYIAIRAAYNNMLKQRPQIAAIIKSSKTIESTVSELKKYDYKKQDLIDAKTSLLKEFPATTITAIEFQLS